MSCSLMKSCAQESIHKNAHGQHVRFPSGKRPMWLWLRTLRGCYPPIRGFVPNRVHPSIKPNHKGVSLKTEPETIENVSPYAK